MGEREGYGEHCDVTSLSLEFLTGPPHAIDAAVLPCKRIML